MAPCFATAVWEPNSNRLWFRHVFHSLRKGFATQLENATIPVTVVARLMGHEIEGQTFGNYSDGLALEQLKAAIGNLDWAN